MMVPGKGKPRVPRNSLSLKKSKNKEVGAGKSNSGSVGMKLDITKFFQKNSSSNSFGEKKTASDEEQKAKKIKSKDGDKDGISNNAATEPVGIEDEIFQNPQMLLKRFGDTVQENCTFVDLDEPTAVNGCLDEICPSTTCDQNYFTANEKGQKPATPSSCKKAKHILFGSPGLPQEDDIMIPPTPPTTLCKDAVKMDDNARRELSDFYSKTKNVNVTSGFFKPEVVKTNEQNMKKMTRNKLTLKRQTKNGSINSLKRSSPSLIQRICVSEKERPLENTLENEMGSDSSVANSTFKMTRKTYKLSRKLKKSTPQTGRKSCESSRKSNEDILLGYGVSTHESENRDSLDQSLPLFNDDDDDDAIDETPAHECFGEGSRKRLAEKGNSPLQKRFSTEAYGLDDGKSQTILFENDGEDSSLSHPVDRTKSCLMSDKQPSEDMLPAVTYIWNTTPKKGSCEHAYDDLLDISMNSLNNDEICKLIDGVGWSPLSGKSNEKPLTPNKQISPARRYVRNKSSELDIMTSNSKIPATNLFGNEDLETDQQDYRTLLVLEVYRRERLDNTCRAGAPEKVLRLFDQSNDSEKYCQLRDDWERTEVEHGDIVNIVGQPSSPTSYILDNETTNYIIVYPDILVTPTAISSSTRCLRKSILEKYFKIENHNEVMFVGTLMHSIFDEALSNEDFSAESALDKARQLLRSLENLTELYGFGITEEDIVSKVNEKVASFPNWGKNYIRKEPHPIHGVIGFKDGGAPKAKTDENVAVCISKVVDIEECVWSPKFGLKGKVDATVEVKIYRNPNILKRNTASYETSILPLELKTGKLYSKLGSVEHRAQVILYTLLMMDRYINSKDTGLLVYLKEGHMVGVPAYLHEKRALIMKRNEMVRYLSLTGGRLIQNMPGMLQDQRSCSYCSHLKVCTLYHKSVENGDSASAGIGLLFDKMTGHLSAVHLEYFVNWNRLISLEAKAMKDKDRQPDAWCLTGLQREQLGYCFSNMLLESCELSRSSTKADQFVNKFVKKDSCTLNGSISEMHLSKGDYVVVSQESGIIALATGFLVDVSEKSVSVLLDKNLTTCYHHTSCTQDVIYRVDKAEISTGVVTQWSNLAKIFFADNEQNAKLRRLIIDLHPPSFARQRDILSSQASGPCSSQLSFCSASSPVKSSQCDSELAHLFNDLNSDQRNAVKKVLAAEDYALILGMPGTGKTTTIACLVTALAKLGRTVLLTSYTHSAVDNILLKLKQSNVDFLRLGSVQKVHPEIQQYAVENAAKHVRNVTELKAFYESKLIVATTCLGVNHSLFNRRSFDYCIVDEASQITQPVCFGPLRHASIFVLVGDHYQLPPLVQSHEARDGGMDISLFKRLSENHPQAVVNLEHQYRMHKDIMLLSNSLIYGHRLKCGTLEIGERLLALPTWDAFSKTISNMETEHEVDRTWLVDVLDVRKAVIFLDTDELPALETRSGHNVFNDGEAAVVASLAQGLVRSGLDPGHVGIISPYRHQLKVIKQSLNIEAGNTTDRFVHVEINTVDKYQGRDKQCVIVSLVRANNAGHVGDLLRDWRRVNVALTRAKHKMILIGSRETLKHNMLFQELIALLEERAWIYKLPKDAWRGALP